MSVKLGKLQQFEQAFIVDYKDSRKNKRVITPETDKPMDVICSWSVQNLVSKNTSVLQFLIEIPVVIL